jgi:hypothetical protein
MATIAPALPPPQARSAPASQSVPTAIAWRIGWCAACLLCGGLVGLALAAVRSVRGNRPARCRVLLVLTGVLAQSLCAGYFLIATVAADAAPCAGLAGTGTTGDGWRAARSAVNAPVSGAAMLYAAAVGGQSCVVGSEGITVTAVPSGYARGGTIYGTVFLTDRTSKKATARIARLSEHEAKHATQWAVATLLAGPVAFPAVYAGDESLFPGAHNQFERLAGLADGGYDAPPDDPPAAGRLLFLLVGLLAGYLAARLRSRRRTPRARDEAEMDGTPAWAFAVGHTLDRRKRHDPIEGNG